MADLNDRDAKLVQYLNEAYGKEKELESALELHIAMTTKAPYKKRLKQHLKETKGHAKQLERRIKKLGGGGHAIQTVVAKATAAAKGPLHVLRGDSEQEKMLKNAKTEYFNEHEEIANYLTIELVAEKFGDTETAKLAKEIRREEERMAKFLEGQVKSLAKAVASETKKAPAAKKATVKKAAKRAAAKKRPAAKKAAAKKAPAKKAGAAKKRPAAKKSALAKKAAVKKPAAKKSAAAKRKK
jgi:ferritin-like metal-binding protein YciE